MTAQRSVLSSTASLSCLFPSPLPYLCHPDFFSRFSGEKVGSRSAAGSDPVRSKVRLLIPRPGASGSATATCFLRDGFGPQNDMPISSLEGGLRWVLPHVSP